MRSIGLGYAVTRVWQNDNLKLMFFVSHYILQGSGAAVDAALHLLELSQSER